MKSKLLLRLDDLAVDSFEIAATADARGTVLGRQDAPVPAQPGETLATVTETSVQYTGSLPTCGTCNFTCAATCNISCPVQDCTLQTKGAQICFRPNEPIKPF